MPDLSSTYLRCTNCGWYQDSFWDREGYWPLYGPRLQLIKNNLFIWDGSSIDSEGHTVPKITGRTASTQILGRAGNSIGTMSVPTLESWGEVENTWECPRCGLTGTGTVTPGSVIP